MAFRRRGFRRAGRARQWDWLRFPFSGQAIPAGSQFTLPLNAIQSDGKTEVITRIRGLFTLEGNFSSIAVPQLANVTGGLIVESARAWTSTQVPNPRNVATFGDSDADFLTIFQFTNPQFVSATQQLAEAMIDVKARRLIDTDNEQLGVVIQNDMGLTVNVAFYLSILTRERGT